MIKLEMKILITFALTLFVGLTIARAVFAADEAVATPSTAVATPAAPATKKVTANADGSQVNVSFDELLIQGQYHFSDEAVVTVEDDKVLDALLGIRKDFKDRIQQSSTR